MPFCVTVQNMHRIAILMLMVTKSTATIRTYFAKLGLEPEIADIYIALYVHGPQTITELSRSSGVERTRIYRLIDNLLESNLFEVDNKRKRGLIKAAPISNLRILISQKEQQVTHLKDELELIEQTLAHNSLASPASQVRFYNNHAGIQQMLWNELDSSTEVMCINFRILEPSVGKEFISQWSDEFAKRGLHSRSMCGDEFISSYKHGQNSSGAIAGEAVKGFEYHYLPPNIYHISHSFEVYDNTVAYFNWQSILLLDRG